MITLFENKKDCCGCGACVCACGKNAITMVEDEYGFVYPQIDRDKCVECGICKNTCAFQHRQESAAANEVYVAASTNKHDIMNSASGGIFVEAAKIIIGKGGVVYGAAMWREDGEFIIRHKRISKKSDLEQLQGSKYVQSDMGDTYRRVRDDLNEDKYVLFSGTPCQCAALRTFLRKEYEKLIVIDIICHGVPSQRFFNDYINTTFAKYFPIYGFKFRDKNIGWGYFIRLDYKDACKYTSGRLTSYITLFLDRNIFRENCYCCKYACSRRPGDLTIGDYWGIQRVHPELMSRYDERKGISCVIVNTEQGRIFMEDMKKVVTCNISSYDKASKKNEQLISPSKVGLYRSMVMELYKNEGYSAVEDFYRRVYRKQRFIHTIYNILPYRVRSFIKRVKS